MRIKIVVFFNSLLILGIRTASAMASRPGVDPNKSAPPGWVTWLPFVVIMFVVYTLMIRPQNRQRRKRQTMLDSIKKGDQIITQGGIYAKVVNVSADAVDVKINEDSKIKIQRSAVTDIIEEKNQQKENQPVPISK